MFLSVQVNCPHTGKNKHRVATCVRCNKLRCIAGRHMCKSCSDTCYRNGTSEQYDRMKRSADEVLDFYAKWRGKATLAMIAEDLGMSRYALERALVRARKRGDVRAKTQPTNMTQRMYYGG